MMSSILGLFGRKRRLALSAVIPVADFSADNTAPSGLPVQFTDLSTNMPTSWLWEKNNGGGWISFSENWTQRNPVETFTPGTHSIRLTASNAAGSHTATKNNYIVAS